MREKAQEDRLTLVRLLSSLFTVDELRHIAMGFTGSAASDDSRVLDDTDSAPLIAYEGIELLGKSKIIDGAFFKALARAYPDRSAEIKQLKEIWAEKIRFTRGLYRRLYVLGVPSAVVFISSIFILYGFGDTDLAVKLLLSILAAIVVALTNIFPLLEMLRFRRNAIKIWWELGYSALTSDVLRLLARAQRLVHWREDGALMVADAVLQVVGADTPSIEHVASLKERLSPQQAAYFVHRGPLPEVVSEALDRLRAEGHPILSLTEEVISSAMADANTAGVLTELEQRCFYQKNLYLQRNAILDRRFLFGRDALLNRAGAALQQRENLLLTGLRKVGKSSSLQILRQTLASHPVCWIDLQKYNPARDDWPRKVFAEVVAAYDRWGKTAFSDWPGAEEAPEDATALERMLAARRMWQEERGRTQQLVVILDELERVLPSPGQEARVGAYVEAAGGLRAMAQSVGSGRISLIAADLRPSASRVNRLPGGETNPFFSFFQELPVPLLDRESVRQMLVGIGRPMGIMEITGDLSEEIYALSGGHPFLGRLIAGEAAERREHPGRLSAADLRAGMDALTERYEIGNFCEQNLWALMEPDEQAVLLAAVRGQALPNHPNAIAALKAHGLLVEGRIAIRVFREWLQEHVTTP